MVDVSVSAYRISTLCTVNFNNLVPHFRKILRVSLVLPGGGPPSQRSACRVRVRVMVRVRVRVRTFAMADLYDGGPELFCPLHSSKHILVICSPFASHEAPVVADAEFQVLLYAFGCSSEVDWGFVQDPTGNLTTPQSTCSSGVNPIPTSRPLSLEDLS